MNNLEVLANALEYIEENITENITPEKVANTCYCSKSSLQNIFKYVCGYSIKEYVIKRRITRASKDLINNPFVTILDIALRYCYSSPEAFTRAFEQVWMCKPSDFRKKARFTEIYPRLLLPIENGEDYMNQRRHVDITELYELFKEREDCYFVCCDIKSLHPINDISHKAGDLAILETAKRMEQAAGNEDIVFRIGGDEFVLLTNSKDILYAENISKCVLKKNGQPIVYEGKEIPLSMYAGVTKFNGNIIKYDELFIQLHNAIRENK